MSDSLRSDPRAVRAQRRATFPVVRARRPSPGRHHPASAQDVRRVLEALGEEAYYGLDLVELVPAPADSGQLPLGALVGAGHLVLYDQPRSPWRLGVRLTAHVRARLVEAGAEIDDVGLITWPEDTLKAFMLRHVLTHEVGHHILQHERRRTTTRAARTCDHEIRAEAIAERLRQRLG